ncbi:Oidioi.mRNA.OKI2018_I69.chr1.g1421.t1.cds [Oikopleura dioica]|uniref:Oidioi.mRNA.OKI2018_I69.chr1.g1421.t1.cds n=1 Tax=Oikopleura dioica TaxID=34765 RepID=A0ABN7SU68_OIKDI|nr:Oidioi.mRNA.OKI2018_I69.chr1.g1421.t1.cds [Oikopleura dioica]
MNSSNGKWAAFSSVPAGMDATFCFKSEEVTTICGNSLCANPATAQYECKCPDDGSSLITEFGIEKCVDPTPPCEVDDPCIAPAVCRNAFDSAFCECPDEGVTKFLSSDGISCEIIDPCSTGLHNCNHPSLECVPTQIAGEYKCENIFECPCEMDCLNPPCLDLADCSGLGSLTLCPEIDCTSIGTYKGQYRCPVGKNGNCGFGGLDQPVEAPVPIAGVSKRNSATSLTSSTSSRSKLDLSDIGINKKTSPEPEKKPLPASSPERNLSSPPANMQSSVRRIVVKPPEPLSTVSDYLKPVPKKSSPTPEEIPEDRSEIESIASSYTETTITPSSSDTDSKDNEDSRLSDQSDKTTSSLGKFSLS